MSSTTVGDDGMAINRIYQPKEGHSMKSSILSVLRMDIGTGNLFWYSCRYRFLSFGLKLQIFKDT